MASGWPIGTGHQAKRELAGPLQVLASEMFEFIHRRLLRYIFGRFLEPGKHLAGTMTLDDAMPHRGRAADVLDNIDEVRQPLDSHCHSPLRNAQQISRAMMPQLRCGKRVDRVIEGHRRPTAAGERSDSQNSSHSITIFSY